MAQELVGPRMSVRRAQPLAAPYWTRLTDVRVPDSRVRIDLVLVGPSGVHVVLELARPSGLSASGSDTELEATAHRAVAAATAVAGLLPVRYRHVVTSEVSLAGPSQTAVAVGEALIASPDVLEHVWQHRPRTVSTSEAAVIARMLRARLEPFPTETTRRPDPWWRRWRWRLVGAAAATGAAGAGAAMFL